MSMVIVMMIVAIFVGPVQITLANQGQFLHPVGVSFAVFSALCLLGVFASLARGNRRVENGGEALPQVDELKESDLDSQ